MAFIHERFLLQNDTAEHLYRRYAANQPIFDYHCHLSARDIAENHQFRDLCEIWLEGDHYKWRAMRANGVDERYCTGDASPYEKFLAWARTVPDTLRNPLYHWTHLELARYFDIYELLDETTAPSIWERANAELTSGFLRAHDILRKFNVRVICTTDDPTDSLQYHEQVSASDLGTAVYPAFRPDAALRTEDPASYNAWLNKLEASANVSIVTLVDLMSALRLRHDSFHEHGCRLSDHGLDCCYSDPCSEAEAAAVFTKVRGGRPVTAAESSKFASFLMLFFGHLDAEKKWTKQLHLGAFRNVNSRMMARVGRDAGFDSINDLPQAQALATYFDRLNREQSLPKMIVYNLNPADNYMFATLVGNFQDGAIAGKMQFGSGWWFLDQKEGIHWQLNALSNAGLLSRFVGMLTDSRSFMSYPRHEYFRRILCNLLAEEIERGELPNDEQQIGSLVENVCFRNAEGYFGLPIRRAQPADSISAD